MSSFAKGGEVFVMFWT